MTEEINFTGTITLEDKPAREMLTILDTRIETINKRTKAHTIDIKNIEKRLKELENDKS